MRSIFLRLPLRILAYLWASPYTLLGLLFIFGSNVRIVRGVIEIHGPLTRLLLNHCWPIGGASAMTLGHVVIGQNQACLDASRKHERIHVRQYETFGPLFGPFYLLASFHAWRTGQDFYYDNFFEAEAYRLDGGEFSV
jgi:hypothetical protein